MNKQEFCSGLGRVSRDLQGSVSFAETVFTPQGSSAYGYTGEIEDENGLVYLRARYYSHELGAFLSLDPHEGDVGNPMSLNGYAYAHGNPINNTDPSGLRTCSDAKNGEPALYTCVDRITDLRTNFGIVLTEEEGLSERLQPLSNWTTQRVANVYTAVQLMSARLGGNTRRAIGDTELRLVQEGTGYGAARASLCNLIRLFLNFTTADGQRITNNIHSVDNIIHEFGYIVTLSPPVGRIANSEALGPADDMQNRPVALWAQIQNNRGFKETEGWNPEYRIGEEDTSAEVVPDMFLYWINYGFTEDDNNFGQARSAFMNGGDIPKSNGEPLHRIDEGNIFNDGSIISSAGIQSWVENTNCPSSVGVDARMPGLESYPEVILANSGWCSL